MACCLHEETRYLIGPGTHGVSFELTEEKFNLLQSKCTKMVLKQENAIQEVVNSKKIDPKPPEETKIYPYEHQSQLIYQSEIETANENKRKPRLKPFEVRLSLGLSGPDLSDQ